MPRFFTEHYSKFYYKILSPRIDTNIFYLCILEYFFLFLFLSSFYLSQSY